jgi:hypothetical protein
MPCRPITPASGQSRIIGELEVELAVLRDTNFAAKYREAARIIGEQEDQLDAATKTIGELRAELAARGPKP